MCLVINNGLGGHTQLVHVDNASSFEVLGETLDDAACLFYNKGPCIFGASATQHQPETQHSYFLCTWASLCSKLESRNPAAEPNTNILPPRWCA